MLLSEDDMQLLMKAGYSSERFVRYDRHGYALLRNRGGHCVFYDVERRRCKAYASRPLGCRLYPAVYSEENVAVVDELCPMGRTVSKMELRKKGEKIGELLRRIELEAASRRQPQGHSYSFDRKPANNVK